MSNKICKISILAMVVFLFACEKVEFDCDYTITANVEEREGGDKIGREGVLMYAFYADTALWKVASYEDALAGRLVGIDENEGNTKMADITVTSNSSGAATFQSIDREPVIMIVCDEVSKRYAWRVAEVYKGLKIVNVSVTFQSWRREEVYVQGRWVMKDDFVADRPQEYTIQAYNEELQDGDKIEIAGVNIHAFYADTTTWEVASYADAVAGKITKKDGSGESMLANSSVMSDTEGLAIFYGEQRPVMIVASDDDKRYAWSAVEELTTWSSAVIIFQLWRREQTYKQEQWTVVDEMATERPEIEPTPEENPS